MIFLVVVICIIGAMPGKENAIYSKKLLPFISDSLFLKTRISGNENLAVISMSSEVKFSPDSTAEYVIDLQSPVLYKCTKDSIILFGTRKLSQPRFFNSDIRIKLMLLDNPEMMDLISDKKYLKLKLEKIE